ncbi:retrotransposon protein, putative, ty3-gypsy subclass [Tanacetum coccineum]|uniref:Retrotransposon protein, putative, ty3-gypsy subclass n=1 Tax=Tanacetum coccineum TaxID=301880 RepID=A0ABQ4Z0Z1_9ASTR
MRAIYIRRKENSSDILLVTSKLLAKQGVELKPLPKIDPKDKGKKKIEEEDESESESDGIPEAEKKFKQLESDEEMARKIQEEWEAEEERNRIAEEKAANEALIRNFDDIKARIEADRLLAEKLQEQEREQFTIEERAKFLHDTIAAQRRFLAQQRSEAIRNRPPTKNQLRNQMMTYLKHVGNFKHAELKIKKFEEVQALYEKIKRSDEDFISIGSAEDERLIKRMNEKGVDFSKDEMVKEKSKAEVKEESKEEESKKKRKLGTRKKMKSRKRRYIQNTSEDDSDKENDELRLHLTIAPDEEKEVDYEILDRKYPIKEWKTECLGTKPQTDQAEHIEEINQNVVIRSNGQKRYFSTLMRVLSIFDREDLNAVYQLVMDRFQDEIPEGFDRVLWGDLMIMFNPDDENEFWNSQLDWTIVSWKLHSSSGVHTLVTETGLVIHMLVEKKYPLRKEVLMQMLKLKLESEEDSTMALELIRWDPGYKKWIHHGEPDLPPPPPAIDNTRQPQMSDMIALLNDLSYIPPNNEQNEPTQGDIGETSNEPTQAKCNDLKSYMPVPMRICTPVVTIHTAKEMTWHATGKRMEPDKMQHPVDGRAWMNFDTKYPNFAKEPRNVRLGLATDGFNPFGNLSRAYNMWPVILTTYNLPPCFENIDVAIFGQHRQGKTRLEKVGHSKWLVAWPNKNGKCSKPQAVYSFIPENRKKFVIRPQEFEHCPDFGSEAGLFATSVMFHLKDSLKKAKSPEIDTYRSQFKSKFPNKDMKEEFLDWFRSQILQRHVDNDPGVSITNELFTLACGPTPTPISVNSCVVNDMSADVARGHGGDGGGNDRPPTHHIPTGCGGCFVNRGKGTRKPNLGGRKAGRLHTRQETRNLRLKKITDDKGPVPIRFEWDDKKTMMPLGDHASHWSNYLGELIKEMPLYYPSWKKVPAKRKATITQFDLKPHMQSQRWTDINASIQQHLQKLYNTNKASLKVAHWVINPKTRTYDVESIRQRRPESITPADWDAQITFWNDPRNQARAAQNRQNRAKSTVVCQQGSRSLARLRDQMMESSSTREYPSLIHTFFVTHTVGEVFMRDEDRALYDEMLRLQRQGSNTETGVPYTEEEIMAGVGRVLSERATDGCPPQPQSTVDLADVEKLKKINKNLTKQVNMMMRLFKSDDKFSQMLTQFESSPEFGGASGSGDDEPGGDEDDDKDEKDGRVRVCYYMG